MSNLTALNFKGNKIGNAGVKSMVESTSFLNNLTTLNLIDSNIDDLGVKAIYTSQHLLSLSVLELSRNYNRSK